jgi:hypothetical protein
MLRGDSQSAKVEESTIHTIPQNDPLANLPIAELEQAIEQFMQPITEHLPDKRLSRVVCLAVQGLSSSQSPIITQMARGLARASQTLLSLVSQSAAAPSGFAQRALCPCTTARDTGDVRLRDCGAGSGQLREALLPAGGRCLHSHEKHPTSFGGQEAFTQGLSCHDGYHCQSVRAVC